MTKTRLAFSLFVLLAGLGLALKHAYFFGPMDLGMDFRVFQRAANWPLDQLYGDRSWLPFVYPPPAIPLFRLFGMLPAGFLIWSVVSVLAFCATVGAVSGKRVPILALCSPAAIGGLILGQVPMILAAAMFGGLKLKPFLGGMLWGVAAIIKPQLVTLAPLALVVRKEWAMLGGMVAGASAASMVSVIIFGPGLWLEWLAALDHHLEELALSGAAIRAITPTGRAALVGLPILPFLLAGMAIATTAVIVAARKVEGELLIGLIVAASIVASPYAHAHDTIALIPACVVLLLRKPWWAAVPAAMVFVGTPGLTMIGMMTGLAGAAHWAVRSHHDERELQQAAG
ncbi:MAG: glycosyltransferase family 87 protein [Sphingomicrobium sp.]